MYNSDLPSRADLPSTKQLVRSTIIAAVVAAVILVAVVLPSEYGLDPTGVGRVLGLTEMGEIKQQLAEEAAADEAASIAASDQDVASPATDAATPADDADSADSAVSADTEPTVDPSGWRDTFTRTLAPAEGKQIKLVMQPGDVATYEWSVDTGHLNSDLHTDNGPDGRSHSYRQGRAETEVEGEFTAISEGAHGWFWRNRSDETVTVTVRIRGTYQGVR